GRVACINLVASGTNDLVVRFRSEASKPVFAKLEVRQREIRAGGVINLYATALGTPPLTFEWLHNGSLISNTTQPSLIISNASAIDTGFYSVRVLNNFGSTE